MPPARRSARRPAADEVDVVPARGRRDPRLADELASPVRRRGPQPPQDGYEDDVDDSDEFGTGVHRVDEPDDYDQDEDGAGYDPEIDRDLDLGLDEEGAPRTGTMALQVGDRMVYKMVASIPGVEGHDRWFTVGAETSVLAHESADDTLTRLVVFVQDALDASVELRDENEREARLARRRRGIPVPRLDSTTQQDDGGRPARRRIATTQED